MSKGKLSKAVSLVVMVAMMNLMMACNVSKSPTGDNVPIANHDSIDNDKPKIISDDLAVTELKSAEWDNFKRCLNVNYSYRTPQGLEYNRQMEFNRSIENDTVVNTIRIYDAVGQEILMLSISCNPYDDDTGIAIVEATQFDTLVWQLGKNNEIINETYIYNGNAFDIEYSEHELSQLNNYIVAESENYKDICLLDAKSNKTLSKFSGFVEFYPQANSLNNNIDGTILTQVWQSEIFSDLIQRQTDIGGDLSNEAVQMSAKEICELVISVGGLKCTFGGFLLNFICHAAVGTTIACIASGTMFESDCD